MVHIHGTSGLNGPVVGPEARESRGCAAFVGGHLFLRTSLGFGRRFQIGKIRSRTLKKGDICHNTLKKYVCSKTLNFHGNWVLDTITHIITYHHQRGMNTFIKDKYTPTPSNEYGNLQSLQQIRRCL